ncbi:MAG: division/cell wall cluster transcriptional repressor MraZ [Qingshengfaniella sp.]
MRHRFRGEHDSKVDGKGRFVIPALFRDVIQHGDPDYAKGGQASIVVVFGGQRDRSLDCYTVTAAEEVQDRIERLERGSPLRTVMEYEFNTCSDLMMMDDTGRLVLPKPLRERLALGEAGGMTKMKGRGDTFQIWHPAAYASDLENTVGAARAELPTGVDPMLLLYQQTGG